MQQSNAPFHLHCEHRASNHPPSRYRYHQHPAALVLDPAEPQRRSCAFAASCCVASLCVNVICLPRPLDHNNLVWRQDSACAQPATKKSARTHREGHVHTGTAFARCHISTGQQEQQITPTGNGRDKVTTGKLKEEDGERHEKGQPEHYRAPPYHGSVCPAAQSAIPVRTRQADRTNRACGAAAVRLHT